MAAIALRPVTEADAAFLQALYATTRADVAALPWADATKADFVAQQFAAREAGYRAQFPDASVSVVLVDGEPAGRLTVARLADELRLVDVALLPRFRGEGMGRELIGRVLADADRDGLPVTLHADRDGAARRLYERLGFEVVSDAGPRVLLRRTPAQPNTAS